MEVSREGERQESQADGGRVGQGMPEAGMLLATPRPRRVHAGAGLPDALSGMQAGLAMRQPGDQRMPGEMMEDIGDILRRALEK